MKYLTTAASAIVEDVSRATKGSEFGSRFQMIVAHALQRHPCFADLYTNFGAGQPDCYSNAARTGVEVKSVDDDGVNVDANSWNALRTYERALLVALSTSKSPYPLWVIDLNRAHSGAFPTTDARVPMQPGSVVDSVLEQFLRDEVSELIEAIGAPRFINWSRDDLRSALQSWSA